MLSRVVLRWGGGYPILVYNGLDSLGYHFYAVRTLATSYLLIYLFVYSYFFIHLSTITAVIGSGLASGCQCESALKVV